MEISVEREKMIWFRIRIIPAMKFSLMWLASYWSRLRNTDRILSRLTPSVVVSVELSQTTREDRLGPFYRVYVDFILRRVVHDLGNSISGINSLSDYHLRSGVNDPALEESLTLIRESAELSRELLVAVGDLLQPADAEEEVVHVQTLIEEVRKSLSMLLPRSVKLETSGLGAKGRGDFGVTR